MSSATLALNGAMTNHKSNSQSSGAFHLTVAAIVVAAAVAVGIASATTLPTANPVLPAKKADRLPVAAVASTYVTVETRSGNTSVLARVPAR